MKEVNLKQRLEGSQVGLWWGAKGDREVCTHVCVCVCVLCIDVRGSLEF